MARRKGKWYVEALDPDDTSNTIRTRVRGPFETSKLARKNVSSGYADGVYELVRVSPIILLVSTETKTTIEEVAFSEDFEATYEGLVETKEPLDPVARETADALKLLVKEVV